MQEALFGNLTIDINETENGKYTGPGGSVFFMAKTFENLGVSATIISPRGVDFPKKYLPQTLFVPTGPLFEKTLIFRNKYQGGKREQGVENYAPYLSFDWQKDLRFVAPDSDIVAVAPILNNIDTNQIKAIKDFFPQSFFVLLPQGFYRQIDKSGNIRHGLWGEEGVVVGLFDFISMSEDDLKDADVRGEAWSREGPIVAVTKAERGATLYRNGQRTDYPAFQVAEI
ncbi:hypothetical protein HY945_03570, partial [Candidatus Gottesmanbacteria bacterium]|nr:hypothetical protein [Candidatus Gottesmanbacteria bacterium]